MITKNKKYLTIAAVLILVLILVFVLGKLKGRTENEQRQIDVKVKIKDDNGQLITYDPNELLIRVHNGLTTTFFWDPSQRCEALEELYQLDSIRFMAAVRAYEEKYGAPLLRHIKACWFTCYQGGKNLYSSIEQRITNLKDIIQ